MKLFWGNKRYRDNFVKWVSPLLAILIMYDDILWGYPGLATDAASGSFQIQSVFNPVNAFEIQNKFLVEAQILQVIACLGRAHKDAIGAIDYRIAPSVEGKSITLRFDKKIVKDGYIIVPCAVAAKDGKSSDYVARISYDWDVSVEVFTKQEMAKAIREENLGAAGVRGAAGLGLAAALLSSEFTTTGGQAAILEDLQEAVQVLGAVRRRIESMYKVMNGNVDVAAVMNDISDIFDAENGVFRPEGLSGNAGYALNLITRDVPLFDVSEDSRTGKEKGSDTAKRKSGKVISANLSDIAKVPGVRTTALGPVQDTPGAGMSGDRTAASGDRAHRAYLLYRTVENAEKIAKEARREVLKNGNMEVERAVDMARGVRREKAEKAARLYSKMKSREEKSALRERVVSDIAWCVMGAPHAGGFTFFQSYDYWGKPSSWAGALVWNLFGKAEFFYNMLFSLKERFSRGVEKAYKEKTSGSNLAGAKALPAGNGDTDAAKVLPPGVSQNGEHGSSRAKSLPAQRPAKPDREKAKKPLQPAQGTASDPALTEKAVLASLGMAGLSNGKPEMRNITKEDELVKSAKESIMSIIMSGKKVVLAFHSDIKGLEIDRLREVLTDLENLKKDDKFGRIFKNLFIIESFSSESTLAKRLGEVGVDPNNSGQGVVFVFSSAAKSSVLRTAAIKAVVINEGRNFDPMLYYYPLPEIVAITLMMYMDETCSVREMSEALRKIHLDRIANIDRVTDDRADAFLVFYLIPNVERYSRGEGYDRYIGLRRAIDSKS